MFNCVRLSLHSLGFIKPAVDRPCDPSCLQRYITERWARRSTRPASPRGPDSQSCWISALEQRTSPPCTAPPGTAPSLCVFWGFQGFGHFLWKFYIRSNTVNKWVNAVKTRYLSHQLWFLRLQYWFGESLGTREREKAGISFSEEPNVQNEALEFEVTLVHNKGVSQYTFLRNPVSLCSHGTFNSNTQEHRYTGTEDTWKCLDVFLISKMHWMQTSENWTVRIQKTLQADVAWMPIKF